MKKMIFASDIDKTLTDERHLIPDEVIVYLAKLYEKGWEIMFLTGRTFSFAMMSVEKISFPFYLAVQNGAEILKMPEKKVLFQHFLPKSVAYFLDGLYLNYAEDFLLYSGLEKGDFCYYRNDRFSEKLLHYLEKLKPLSPSDWVAVKGLEDIDQSAFPLIKGLGEEKALTSIQTRLRKIEHVTSSLIFDSVEPCMKILLITHKEANKGSALKRLKQLCKGTCKVVAAGDDRNDIPLLEEADIKIAMSTGPSELKKLATIIAPPSHEFGILKALSKVESLLSQHP